MPVSAEWLGQIKIGDRIKLEDTRGKKRVLTVTRVQGEVVVANCYDGCYIGMGTTLALEGQVAISEAEVGQLPATMESLNLKVGDKLQLHKDRKPGEPAQYNLEGELLQVAHISCTAPEIFDSIMPGEKLLFDDGKIAGVVSQADPEQLEIEILYAKPGGSSLRADKGINLPQSQLRISGLTAKDREDLKFIAHHADVVNFSFVNSPEDVQDLLAEIESLEATNRLGVILKIETQNAFNNLADILLEAMRVRPVGVMIARGDLAIETGWENIARVQSEILSLCYAAHIPNIWATQVLENLAKKGIPSRAEITDAATSLRSECVMLNKGPHITNAIRLLDHILKTLEEYQDKNAPLLPEMKEVRIQ